MKKWGWILSLCIMVALLGPLGGQAKSAAKTNTAKQKAESVKLPYKLEVDLTHQLVFAYSTEDDSIVRTMICSTGEKAHWTPKGTFYMPASKKFATERGPWHAVVGSDYARYATRIRGSILFHSVVYDRRSTDSLDRESWERLGEPASHGCIRLTPLDAQWIAYNCEPYTEVTILLAEEDAARKQIHDEIKNSLPSPDEDGRVGAWEPTLRPTPAPNASPLKLDSKGDGVKKLQTRLKEIGFFDGKANGTYAEDTETAIKGVESKLGLEETGIATVELQGYIYAENAPIGSCVALKKGDRGLAVVEMQRKLKRLGLFDGHLNGIFDQSTVDAVRKFYEFVDQDAKSTATQEMQMLLAQWVQ